jgi:hypothetical protein
MPHMRDHHRTLKSCLNKGWPDDPGRQVYDRGFVMGNARKPMRRRVAKVPAAAAFLMLPGPVLAADSVKGGVLRS